jgi:hypothetical protein
MSKKSRRRLTLAAGAILAGAAIPIAAAGTAWADDDTMTVAQAEKLAKAGEQVEISVNGKTIKDTCVTCFADSGTTGEHNTAIAVGAGSEATVSDATDSTAKASGAGDAFVGNIGGTEAVSHDTATATNGGGATVLNDGTSTVAVTHDTVIGNNGDAQVFDAGSSKATAVNTGSGANEGAFVDYATDSTAKAENAGSEAHVVGTTSSYITGSSAVETLGGTTEVTASDTHEVNGMVVPHVEMTPLTEPHMMPPTPLP